MAEYDPITVAHLWSKVRIPAAPRHENMCWPWCGSTAKGYGQIKISGGVLRAHRVAWEVVNGPLPAGQFILHSCDNPLCCNPAHLRPGTHQDNMDDMVARGRRANGAPQVGGNRHQRGTLDPTTP